MDTTAELNQSRMARVRADRARVEILFQMGHWGQRCKPVIPLKEACVSVTNAMLKAKSA